MPASSPWSRSSSRPPEAAALGPAQVHAQEHLGPVLGVGAAGAGVNLQDGRALSSGTVSRMGSSVRPRAWRSQFAQGPPEPAASPRLLRRQPGPASRPRRPWPGTGCHMPRRPAGFSRAGPGSAARACPSSGRGSCFSISARRSGPPKVKAASRSVEALVQLGCPGLEFRILQHDVLDCGLFFRSGSPQQGQKAKAEERKGQRI